jgi:hypothetical protein
LLVVVTSSHSCSLRGSSFVAANPSRKQSFKTAQIDLSHASTMSKIHCTTKTLLT